ncbi:MAG: neuraminidase-like domain-containing protein, partial [Myxococcota bacterium]
MKLQIEAVDPARLTVAFVDSDGDLSQNSVAAVGLRVTAAEDFGAFDVALPLAKVAFDLGRGRRLRELLDTSALLTRLGIPLDTAFGWSTPTPTRTHASEVRAVARALAGSDAAWQGPGQALRDEIREVQQRALAAYLGRDGGPVTSSEFYARYLVDSAMDPCMTTSRLKLAILSVQTYVNQVLLGQVMETATSTEPLRIEGTDATAWRSWRGRYRMWEAARKVLFFAENWLQPTLRAERSPEYDRLNARLQRSGLDQTAAREVYASFLREVAQLGNPLVACVAYEEPEGEDARREFMGRIHMVARSGDGFEQPIYRVGEPLGGSLWRWSPWVSLPFGLPQDAENIRLAMKVYGDELLMMWVEVLSKTQNGGQGEDGAFLVAHFAVRSADGEWSAPKIAHTWMQLNFEYVDLVLVSLGEPEADDWIQGGFDSGLHAVIRFSTFGNPNDLRLQWSPTLRRWTPAEPFAAALSTHGIGHVLSEWECDFESAGDGRVRQRTTRKPGCATWPSGTDRFQTPNPVNNPQAPAGLVELVRHELWGTQRSMVFPLDQPRWESRQPFVIQYEAHSYLVTADAVIRFSTFGNPNDLRLQWSPASGWSAAGPGRRPRSR